MTEIINSSALDKLDRDGEFHEISYHARAGSNLIRRLQVARHVQRGPEALGLHPVMEFITEHKLPGPDSNVHWIRRDSIRERIRLPWTSMHRKYPVPVMPDALHQTQRYRNRHIGRL
jgi:hypothetical protein